MGPYHRGNQSRLARKQPFGRQRLDVLARRRESLAIFDFTLDNLDMQTIMALNLNRSQFPEWKRGAGARSVNQKPLKGAMLGAMNQCACPFASTAHHWAVLGASFQSTPICIQSAVAIYRIAIAFQVGFHGPPGSHWRESDMTLGGMASMHELTCERKQLHAFGDTFLGFWIHHGCFSNLRPSVYYSLRGLHGGI
jgi:hypothetical protein